LLKLNVPHFNKLRELFARHGAAEEKSSDNMDETAFKNALYNMLSRYGALLGHGMQVPRSDSFVCIRLCVW
jgi:hypothetical protein